MKRVFGIIAILIFSFAFVGFAIYLNAHRLLAHVLSTELNTHVSISQMLFRPPQINIIDLTVRNPKNFSFPTALSVKDISIKAPYLNYLREVVYIDEIALDHLHFTVEFAKNNKSENNWDDILSDSENPQGLPIKEDRYAVIKDLYIRNIKVEILFANGKIQKHTIKRIHLQNVTTKQGDLTAKLTQEIIFNIIYNLDNIIQIPLLKSQEALKGVFQGFDLFFPWGWGGKKNAPPPSPQGP